MRSTIGCEGLIRWILDGKGKLDGQEATIRNHGDEVVHRGVWRVKENLNCYEIRIDNPWPSEGMVFDSCPDLIMYASRWPLFRLEIDQHSSKDLEGTWTVFLPDITCQLEGPDNEPDGLWAVPQ